MKYSKKKIILPVVAFVLLIFFINIVTGFFVIIDTGELGVVKLFGNVSDKPLEPGFNFKNPFATVIRMPSRTAEYTMSQVYNEGVVQGDDSIEARAADGALVFLDVTVFYRLNKDNAVEIYKTLGLEYEEKFVRPEIRSTIRQVASEYPVVDLYSSKRSEAENKLLDYLADSLRDKGIIVEDVLLRNVVLTSTLSASIEDKLAAQQEAEKLDFLLQREEKEAQRKVIEAQGQQDAQRLISESLTPQYLYYLYINNLKDLEGSVYVPTEGGLPLLKVQ
jgi:regulator of protease activity HflC (stomatin/prohibitin superfamily)